MKVYPPRDIRPFVMYCVNGKPRSSLLLESTDSMILILILQWTYRDSVLSSDARLHVHPIHFLADVQNKNKNKKPKWRFFTSRSVHLNCAIMAMLYSHSIGNQPRTRWWCLKCVIVYQARDNRPFVMYCVNGKPRSSLLIESTDSTILLDKRFRVQS